MIRKKIFKIIEPTENGCFYNKVFDCVILSLIIINIFSVIIESFSGLSANVLKVLKYIEVVSVGVFTVEYSLRIITSDFKYSDQLKIKSILKYIFSFMAIIDLLAILPFFLPLLLPIDLRFLRILRLVRLLRVLKVNRYTESLKIIGNVLKAKKEELFVTIFVTLILLLLSSSIMYYVETEAQPEAFPNIIASLWWAIATLTTVGYGDVYPVTVIGKILSGIIALLGIGLVALPSGIIASEFLSATESEKLKENQNGNDNNNIIDKFKKVSELRETGLLTQKEYEDKKRELLERI